jgi:hypothetical protein
MKSRKIRLAGHVERMGKKRNTYCRKPRRKEARRKTKT